MLFMCFFFFGNFLNCSYELFFFFLVLKLFVSFSKFYIIYYNKFFVLFFKIIIIDNSSNFFFFLYVCFKITTFQKTLLFGDWNISFWNNASKPLVCFLIFPALFLKISNEIKKIFFFFAQITLLSTTFFDSSSNTTIVDFWIP